MPVLLARARTLAVLPLLAVLLVIAPPATPSAEAASLTKIRQAVRIAGNQVGDPYRYGAEGPHRFDCSGLIYFSYRKAGISVPRTSSQQARHARRIKKSRMRRGDLMFFYSSSGVYHVAVFTGWRDGRRRMIHSPSTGKRVHRSTPWTSRWFAGTLR